MDTFLAISRVEAERLPIPAFAMGIGKEHVLRKVEWLSRFEYRKARTQGFSFIYQEITTELQLPFLDQTYLSGWLANKESVVGVRFIKNDYAVPWGPEVEASL